MVASGVGVGTAVALGVAETGDVAGADEAGDTVGMAVGPGVDAQAATATAHSPVRAGPT